MNINQTIKHTKILATIGPATDDYDVLEQAIRAGVNGCRMNFSHGTAEQRETQFRYIREISEKIGRHVSIIQDLQGPKIRLGQLKDDMRYEIHTGDELGLTYGIDHDGGNNLPVQYDLSEKAQIGEAIYLFDGKIKTIVTRIDGKTVWVRAENNGYVISRKAVNLPDTDFGTDFISEKDYADLEWGLDKDYDYTAISFVHTADDIHMVRQWLKDHGVERPIITKVETKTAIMPENLEEIVKASDGVMVARGDLAVEVGAEVVPVVQREIISLCQKHCKFSIVATQMLASMVDNPEPTRAEVSDVATASIDGADVVMLSDETAMGSYPVEAVEVMAKTLLYAQHHLPVSPLYDSYIGGGMRDAIADSAVLLAEQIEADAIIVETTTGQMASTIAVHRPHIPVLAISQSLRVANQMALLYNTLGFVGVGDDYGWSTVKKLTESGFFAEADKLKFVVVRRVPSDDYTETIANTIQVRTLER